MPRIARVVAEGYPHHVTQRGNNREWVFLDDEDRSFYLAALERYCRKYKVCIWAYCLMDNHVHILAVPAENDSLARALGTTNLVYSQFFNRKRERCGRIWQNRFFSCVVDRQAYLWAVARYIERNPVRIGRVEQAVAYRWSSAKANSSGHADSLLFGADWLEAEERSQYAAFLCQPDKEAELIRKATMTGFPLGAERFVLQVESLTQRRIRPIRQGRPRRSKED